MSQSDYLHLKRQAVILNEQKDLEKILSSQQFTEMKSFVLERSIQNTLVTNNKLVLPKHRIVLDMDSNICAADFKLCINTNQRTNRHLNAPNNEFNKSYRRIATNEYFSFLKKNYKLCVSNEFKKCDEFIYNRGVRWDSIQKRLFDGTAIDI